MIRKRSEIYEIVIQELKKSGDLQKVFRASEMQSAFKIANKGSKQFIYKHANINYENKFTIFFVRDNSSPIGFKINHKIYNAYINKFGEI